MAGGTFRFWTCRNAGCQRILATPLPKLVITAQCEHPLASSLTLPWSACWPSRSWGSLLQVTRRRLATDRNSNLQFRPATLPTRLLHTLRLSIANDIGTSGGLDQYGSSPRRNFSRSMQTLVLRWCRAFRSGWLHSTSIWVSAPAPIRSPSVAWLPFPDFDLERDLDQIYSRLNASRYRYESASGKFITELEVDSNGFVTEYPGFFGKLCRHFEWLRRVENQPMSSCPEQIREKRIISDKGFSVFLRQRASEQLALATYRFLSYRISFA